MTPGVGLCPVCRGENHSGADRLTEVETGRVAVGGGTLRQYTVCPACAGTGVAEARTEGAET